MLTCKYHIVSQLIERSNFVFFSLSGTHDFFYQLTSPARVYYHATRWFFGNDYVPFGNTMNDEIHPISLFVLNNYERIRFILSTFPFITPVISIMMVIYLIQRTFPSKMLFSKSFLY